MGLVLTGRRCVEWSLADRLLYLLGAVNYCTTHFGSWLREGGAKIAAIGDGAGLMSDGRASGDGMGRKSYIRLTAMAIGKMLCNVLEILAGNAEPRSIRW